MSNGNLDEATEIIKAWLNHDRTLNELASGALYDSGVSGLKWWLDGLIWLPGESQKAFGIDGARIQIVRNKLSPEAFHAANWDAIRTMLIGE